MIENMLDHFSRSPLVGYITASFTGLLGLVTTLDKVEGVLAIVGLLLGITLSIILICVNLGLIEPAKRKNKRDD
jgi:hypothetical protein